MIFYGVHNRNNLHPYFSNLFGLIKEKSIIHEKFREDVFLITSIYPGRFNKDANVEMKIQIHKGTHRAYIARFVDRESEKELLLDKGQLLKITNIKCENGKWFVEYAIQNKNTQGQCAT